MEEFQFKFFLFKSFIIYFSTLSSLKGQNQMGTVEGIPRQSVHVAKNRIGEKWQRKFMSIRGYMVLLAMLCLPTVALRAM